MSNNSQDIQQIKNQLSIVDVVERYLPLKKSGSNYLGLCPFHDEKSPSFNVNPSLGIFKCFGCGKSGDIITFVQDMDKLTFPEALEKLAKQAGIKLSKSFSKGQKISYNQDQVALEVNHMVMKIWERLLWQSPQATKARDYLKTRGITSQTAKKYHLGFALDSWDMLLKLLRQKGYSQSTLLKIGLVKQAKDSSRFYDRFRNRLMFPIINQQGKVIGFSGRILNENQEVAKYLNSPDSSHYHKGSSLFGMFQALDALRLQEKAFIVEGNLDVLHLHQAGFFQVIAPLGTSLTKEQVQLLARYCRQVTLAFDSDPAGEKATLRSLSLLQEQGLEAFVLLLPNQQDPADFFKEKTPKDWNLLAQKALPVVEYRLQNIFKKHDLNSAYGKQEAVLKSLKILSSLPPTSQDYYIKYLAQEVLIDSKILYDELKRIGKQTPAFYNQEEQGPYPATNPIKRKITGSFKLEKRLLKVFLQNFSFLYEKGHKINLEWFQEKKIAGIFKKALQCDPNCFTIKTFYESLAAEEKTFIEEEFWADQEGEITLSAQELWSSLAQSLEKAALEKGLRLFDRQIAKLGSDLSQIKPLQQKKQLLFKRLHNLD